MSNYDPHYGQGMSIARNKPGVESRIEWLGRMHDAYTKALDAGDAVTLLEIADKYEQRGMNKTAKDIRLTVSRMKGI